MWFRPLEIDICMGTNFEPQNLKCLKKIPDPTRSMSDYDSAAYSPWIIVNIDLIMEFMIR